MGFKTGFLAILFLIIVSCIVSAEPTITPRTLAGDDIYIDTFANGNFLLAYGDNNDSGTNQEWYWVFDDSGNVVIDMTGWASTYTSRINAKILSNGNFVFPYAYDTGDDTNLPMMFAIHNSSGDEIVAPKQA
ncbi:unnamed protein product, partial [marine sediment metagenome]